MNIHRRHVVFEFSSAQGRLSTDLSPYSCSQIIYSSSIQVPDYLATHPVNSWPVCISQYRLFPCTLFILLSQRNKQTPCSVTCPPEGFSSPLSSGMFQKGTWCSSYQLATGISHRTMCHQHAHVPTQPITGNSPGRL